MSRDFKEFWRKVENRKFAIENSWRGSGEKTSAASVGKGKDSGRQLPWQLLDENLEAADACKVFDGYLPLESHHRIVGKWIIFIKRGMRKLLKIFWGWYIFPQYQRMSHFHGKVVNALCLERDILAGVVQENQQFAERLQLQSQQTETQIESFQMKLRQCEGDFEAKLSQQNQNLQMRMDRKETEVQACMERIQQQIQKLEQENQSLREKLNKLENLPTDDEEFYHCFEEKFRGSQELIRERQQTYVPVIKQYIPDFGKARFVDVGSGRGEWLDILRENGAADYVGVDLNARQNALCAARGHRVVEMDCNAYLATLQDSSVDMVSGFQLIEHLCMSDLVELFRQSYRVLKPGGIILFETPDPRNLTVGADTFYMGPSHKRPLEPKLVEFLVEWCGYKVVRCIDANACPNWAGVTSRPEDPDLQEVIRQFNDVNYRLFGPRDYAILAVKE